MLVVSASGLAKRFYASTTFADLLRGRLRGRPVDALDGADLEVSKGEIVGVLGENGAGKSTLLRLLAGLLYLDRGTLEVLGAAADARRPRLAAGLRRRVSYVVSDERSFSWRLTGEQNLAFFAALYGLAPRRATPRVAHALATVGLASDAGRAVREYSTGMRSRLALARALLGEPELWLFDEPTRGVDPHGASKLRRLLRDELVTGAGATAVVATHDLIEVEQLCDRVLILARGRVVGAGPAAEASGLLERAAAREEAAR